MDWMTTVIICCAIIAFAPIAYMLFIVFMAWIMTR